MSGGTIHVIEGLHVNWGEPALGEIVDLLEQFKAQPSTLLMPKMPEGSFAKKLYSLYLTYLPKEKFKYDLQMNVDDRGSFTELLNIPVWMSTLSGNEETDWQLSRIQEISPK